MEPIGDTIVKRFEKTLVHVMKVIDPARQYSIDQTLGEAWDALTLTEQRRMYLYLLYRKWRGDGFYGTPYEIITNCHPYPTNWNGKYILSRLMKENKMVSAKFEGTFGIYTRDEAFVWQMTEVKELN